MLSDYVGIVSGLCRYCAGDYVGIVSVLCRYCVGILSDTMSDCPAILFAPLWNTADTTQRAVLLMTEVTCMRDVVLVREAGGAGGIFGIAALGCVLHACYLHRIHNIPYSGYFLLFLKFTALYTLYSSLGFPPLYILPRSAEHTLRRHHASREQNVETHYRSV